MFDCVVGVQGLRKLFVKDAIAAYTKVNNNVQGMTEERASQLRPPEERRFSLLLKRTHSTIEMRQEAGKYTYAIAAIED